MGSESVIGFLDTVDNPPPRETGVDPATIRIEITETMLLGDTETAIKTLRALKALGLQVAIDDFGTGYSSLGYLRRLPVDVLKIDQTFVSELDRDQTSRSIVRAVVAMAEVKGVMPQAKSHPHSGGGTEYRGDAAIEDTLAGAHR